MSAVRTQESKTGGQQRLVSLLASCDTCKNANFDDNIVTMCEKCFNTWSNRKNNGENLGKLKFIQCKNCSNGFAAKVWGTKYCSEECRHAANPTFVYKNTYTADEELLTKLYVEEEKSTTEIAAILGCSQPTVVNRLKKFEIPMRGRNGAAGRAKNKANKKQ